MQAKSLVLTVLLVSAAAGSATAHGAFYPPTVDPSPPAAPGRPPAPPAGGSNPGPGDTVPTGPSAPSNPGPGPATGGGGRESGPAPSTPTRPTGPATGGGTSTGPTTPKTPSVMGGATGAMAASAADPTGWETWWYFNKDRYLELKAHVAALEIVTGSDDAFLGLGGHGHSVDVVSERALPALLQLLGRERGSDAVTGAMIALARSADGGLSARAPELARVFAGFTDDPNQEIAETSVVARGIVGDVASVAELVDLLENGDAAKKRRAGRDVTSRSRAFAGYALGLIGARTQNEDLRRFIVHHLVRTLREDRGALPDVQVACIIALGLTPLAWSQDGRDDVRSPATPAAARKSTGAATASRETQLECLLALFGDVSGDRWVRAHVPAALARLSAGAGDAVREEIARTLVERIAPTAREKDEVVQGCVLALGSLCDADRDDIDVKVRIALKAAVENGDQQSRRFALIALAQGAARPGQSGLDDGVLEVRNFLASRLSEGRSHERCWAALALGILEHGLARQAQRSDHAFGDERAAKRGMQSLGVRAQVLAALRDAGSGTEVGALAISCGLMGDRNATPVLLAKLDRTSEGTTLGHLAVGLGLLGDPAAAQALRAQLATARFKPELLRDTGIGLALLEDPTLVPALIETLEKASSLSSQSAAASVLGWIGDRRTIEPLVELMSRREATLSARAFAAVALGRVCDQDRMPWNAAVAEDVHYRAATPTLTSPDGTGLLDIL